MCTYGDLENELLTIVLSLDRVENGRELSAIELDCDIISNGSYCRDRLLESLE